MGRDTLVRSADEEHWVALVFDLGCRGYAVPDRQRRDGGEWGQHTRRMASSDRRVGGLSGDWLGSLAGRGEDATGAAEAGDRGRGGDDRRCRVGLSGGTCVSAH